ncbi:Uncharacterised protein [Yersinia ruckeri]|nr:hypothetical protein QMA0440_01960 [Yersinia ruckeri]KFE37316.1 hypothetical protein nADLYRO1b_3325 [Yersinia ruckeri]CNA96763.1 Uncharacterised protein [Yersinia ruckeri]
MSNGVCLNKRLIHCDNNRRVNSVEVKLASQHDKTTE